jgi:murein L,D-transpeptidase YafK
MGQWMGRFLLLSLFFFSTVNAQTLTLEELILKLHELKPKEIAREIERLPQEEKMKLQLLFLSYTGQNEEAEKLLKELYPKKLITNVLELPENSAAIVVDKTKEILYIVKMEKGVPRIIREFPCITGKRPGDKLEEGDLRTPEGIYFPLCWKTGLPPMYGIGAYPLNYPNLLDREVLKRNGHGIWIHGTNNPSRPPHSTNGCIVLRNEYLKELRKIIKPKVTPVVIVSNLSFANRDEYLEEKKSILDFILRWKEAWENTPQDISKYLSFYSKNFVWEKGGYNEWIKYKTRITRFKKWIRIKLSDITATKDGRLLQFGTIYVVSFLLDYRSNNYSSKGRKLLYVIKEDGKWKILGEENL